MAERSLEESRNRFEVKVLKLSHGLQEFYFRLNKDDQNDIIRYSKRISKLKIRELGDLGSVELSLILCRLIMAEKVQKMLCEVPVCKREQANRVIDWRK